MFSADKLFSMREEWIQWYFLPQPDVYSTDYIITCVHVCKFGFLWAETLKGIKFI